MAYYCGEVLKPASHGHVPCRALQSGRWNWVLPKEVEVIQRSRESGPGLENSGSRKDWPVLKMESIPIHCA